MTASLPPSAEKVQAAARRLDLSIRIVEMAESTRTAEEAAAACGCEPGQIVKSLIFRGAESGEPYLLLVSGSNRVNEKAVATILGEVLARPNADYVRQVTGFAIGGIPPFGHDTSLPAFMDEDLLRFETVWAAAGTPRAVFEVAPDRLAKAIAAKIIRMT